MQPGLNIPIAIGPQGLDLTPFARLVSRREDCEVQYVQLVITVNQVTIPLRLAVATFFRISWEGHPGSTVAEWTLLAIPGAVQQCFLVLTRQGNLPLC